MNPCDRATPSGPRVDVLDDSGCAVTARWPALLERRTARDLPGASDAMVDSTAPGSREGAMGAVGERSAGIAATTGGAGFQLAGRVDALCAMEAQPIRGRDATAAMATGAGHVLTVVLNVATSRLENTSRDVRRLFDSPDHAP